MCCWPSHPKTGSISIRMPHRPEMERLLEVNGLPELTKAVVETARQTLVIGEA